LAVRPRAWTRLDREAPSGQFLRNLTAFQGADELTKIATRLALLTFVRSQELRFAKWDEVDVEAREWRIPAGRTKMAKGSKQAHVVPLSAAKIRTLKDLREITGWSSSLFPKTYGGDKFMSENTIGRMPIRLGYQHRQTRHGFRASARSCCRTKNPCLSHRCRELHISLIGLGPLAVMTPSL